MERRSLRGMAEAAWARRRDGVEVGVVPFGSSHPCSALSGQWHVQVRRPGGWPMSISAPTSQDAAKAAARNVWATWPQHTPP